MWSKVEPVLLIVVGLAIIGVTAAILYGEYVSRTGTRGSRIYATAITMGLAVMVWGALKLLSKPRPKLPPNPDADED